MITEAENMSTNSVEAEYQDIVKRNAWNIVYRKLNQECQLYPYTCLEARKPQNKQLNRYRDVNPYDHSRVVLQRSDKDYINANLVKMARANRKYILTQGPLVFTVSHFWLMVWEQKSRAILMLNKVIEKNEMKCYWYWPQSSGEEGRMVLSDVNLQIEQTEQEDHGYYYTRYFKVTDTETQEEREVIQYHYTTWPDFGVPQSPVAFLNFLKQVRASGALDPDVGPAVVHCSAGIGRSGTFCLVDSCLVIIEKEGIDAVNIQEVLKELRKDRMGLIQTPDQLRFSYQAIIEGAKRLDPNYVDEEEAQYSAVSAETETPPQPPRRSESLLPPVPRKVPKMQISESLGRLSSYGLEHKSKSADSSDSDSTPPTPPAKDHLPSPVDDEDEDSSANPPNETQPLAAGDSEMVRRRRARDTELADRISSMKRRAHDADRWNEVKRSLFKPLTFTLGVIVAGILIYTYVKH